MWFKDNKCAFVGCSLYLRSDYGTENCTTAALHIALHHDNLGQRSYIYGQSKHNIVSYNTPV